MSAWTCRSTDSKAADKIVPPRLRIPYWKGRGADSEEKHEPVSDIDTAVVDSLKALDPKRPIREADIFRDGRHVTEVPEAAIRSHRPHSAGGLFGQPRFPKTLNKQL
jgi:hypothetical protein